MLYNANVIRKQGNNYRIGRHARRKARKHLWLGILIVLLVSLGVGIFFVVRLMGQTSEEVTMPEPITREYAPPAEDEKVLDQGIFTISLPTDWRLKAHDTSPTRNKYEFQATEKGKDNRWLEIYVDSAPVKQAFNRLLPVSVDSNQIFIAASVSDNCTAFTGPQNDGQPVRSSSPTLPAKWQGVPFLCDMANSTRNVVGVGTESTGHNLTLTGTKSGKHTFFVVYTDHNINPDYQILEQALESIKVN